VRRAIFLVVLSALTLPASASAGSYEVTVCTRPDGSSLPTDRWEPFASTGAGSTRNECRDGLGGQRQLEGELAANTRLAKGQYAGWSFTAPPDTTIGSYTLWRSIRSASGFEGDGKWAHSYFLYHDARVPFDSTFVSDTCVDATTACAAPGDPTRPYSEANRRGRSGVDVKRLYAVMECVGAGPSCPPVASPGRLRIYSAQIGITDLHAPALRRAPTGSLVDTRAPVAGDRSLSIAADDKGGGIARVAVVVDGRRLAERSFDPAAASCATPYTIAVPCPLSGQTTLNVDTAQLPNGTHTVQASVTDAAGNETRSDPVTVTTLNGSAPNGRGASRFVRLSAWLRSRRNARRASAVVPFGSVRTVEGRLTDAGGAPISDALLDVSARVQRPGAVARHVGAVRTNANGRFAYRVARGPSRTLSFDYKAYTLDPAPVSSARVSLGVRAGLRLRLTPRRVRNGERIRFLGRLRGGPARKGTRVAIDVLVPDARRRVPIGNVRADEKGRFRFAYRFRRTLVKARYRFQARLVPQPGYPYRGATSGRRSVLVEP
jgi:hypothetical protein